MKKSVSMTARAIAEKVLNMLGDQNGFGQDHIVEQIQGVIDKKNEFMTVKEHGLAMQMETEGIRRSWSNDMLRMDALRKSNAEMVKAFEEYIDNTVGEYGESRMFDCGVEEARKAIAKAKK